MQSVHGGRILGRWTPLAGAACLLVVVACPRDGDRKDVRTRLLAEAATNYAYSTPRPPIVLQPGKGPPIRAMRVAGARRKDETGRDPRNRFLGYIESDSAYAPLGLAAGKNYIWTDSVASWRGDATGHVRVLIVPEDSASAMTWLKIDSAHARIPRSGASAPRGPVFIPAVWSPRAAPGQANSEETNPLLRLTPTALVACMDGCSSGHCATESPLSAYDSAKDDESMDVPQ